MILPLKKQDAIAQCRPIASGTAEVTLTAVTSTGRKRGFAVLVTLCLVLVAGIPLSRYSENDSDIGGMPFAPLNTASITPAPTFYAQRETVPVPDMCVTTMSVPQVDSECLSKTPDNFPIAVRMIEPALEDTNTLESPIAIATPIVTTY